MLVQVDPPAKLGDTFKQTYNNGGFLKNSHNLNLPPDQ